MNPDVFTLARRMLELKEGERIHPWLVDYLTEANEWAGKVGGEIVSRQVVGLAIATWRRLNPEEKPVLTGDPKP